jgi:hypothetical protein
MRAQSRTQWSAGLEQPYGSGSQWLDQAPRTAALRIRSGSSLNSGVFLHPGTLLVDEDKDRPAPARRAADILNAFSALHSKSVRSTRMSRRLRGEVVDDSASSRRHRFKIANAA